MVEGQCNREVFWQRCGDKAATKLLSNPLSSSYQAPLSILPGASSSKTHIIVHHLSTVQNAKDPGNDTKEISKVSLSTLCVQNVSLWHFKCWAHTYIHEFSRRQCQPLSLNVVVLIFSLTLVAKMKQWYTYMQQKSKRTYLYAVVVLGIQSNLSQSQ